MVLILKREAVTDEMGIASPMTGKDTESVATKRMELIYKTEKEYLVSCDTCDAKVFSLPADVVKAVIWKQ